MLNVIQIKIMKMNTIGERISWARKNLGLSQDELARLAEVAPGTIGNIESGRGRTLRKLIPVARALRVDPVWLAEGVGAPYADHAAGAAPVPAVAMDNVVYLDATEFSHLTTWRKADPDARTVIASAFAVADRLEAPLKHRA